MTPCIWKSIINSAETPRFVIWFCVFPDFIMATLAEPKVSLWTTKTWSLQAEQDPQDVSLHQTLQHVEVTWWFMLIHEIDTFILTSLLNCCIWWTVSVSSAVARSSRSRQLESFLMQLETRAAWFMTASSQRVSPEAKSQNGLTCSFCEG